MHFFGGMAHYNNLFGALKSLNGITQVLILSRDFIFFHHFCDIRKIGKRFSNKIVKVVKKFTREKQKFSNHRKLVFCFCFWWKTKGAKVAIFWGKKRFRIKSSMSQKYRGAWTSSENFQLSSLTYSQILAKSSCGWSPSPVHQPHKIVLKYFKNILK